MSVCVVIVPQWMRDLNYTADSIVSVNAFLRDAEFAGALGAEARPDADMEKVVARLLKVLNGLGRSYDPQAISTVRKLLAEAALRRNQVEVLKALERFQTRGLEEDTKLRLSEDGLCEIEELIEKLIAGSDGKGSFSGPRRLNGGNAAITCERARYYGCRSDHDMPAFFFAGSIGEDFDAYVGEVVKKRCEAQTIPGVLSQSAAAELALVKEGFPDGLRVPPGAAYRTVALSSERRKLMLNLFAGDRSPLLDLADDKGRGALSFRNIAGRICDHAAFQEAEVKVLALASTSAGTADEWLQFVADFREVFRSKFGDMSRLLLAVSTSGFRSDAHAKEMFEKIFCQADLISLSIEELEKVHAAVCGANPEMSSAHKLRDLPMANDALKVVHAPSGAIMDVLRIPNGLLDDPEYTARPMEFLSQCLRWAVDGTTAALEDSAGRRFSAQQVRTYSDAVQYRQKEAFSVDFIHPDPFRELPAGIIGAPSPYVVRRRGDLVGLGATFDGILFANLLRRP